MMDYSDEYDSSFIDDEDEDDVCLNPHNEPLQRRIHE